MSRDTGERAAASGPPQVRDVTAEVFRRSLAGPHGDLLTTWSPAVDVDETADGFLVAVELPGVRPEDVRVDLEDAVLVITGTRVLPSGQRLDRLSRHEGHVGPFTRALEILAPVDAGAARATVRDGLLLVRIPRGAGPPTGHLPVEPG